VKKDGLFRPAGDDINFRVSDRVTSVIDVNVGTRCCTSASCLGTTPHSLAQSRKDVNDGYFFAFFAALRECT